MELWYSNYKISQSLLGLYKQKAYKKKYEFKNILERFLLNRANLKGTECMFMPLVDDVTDVGLLNKMYNELIAKKIKINIEDVPPCFIQENTSCVTTSKPYIRKGDIIYKDFRWRIDDRTRLLIRKYSLESVTLTALKYASLLSGGQQWSMPKDAFKYLSVNNNFNYEGYASPFNSFLLPYNGLFCSLFDTDNEYGSIGTFNYKKITQYCNCNWIVNPPYTEYILEYATNQVLKALELTSIAVVMLVPNWKDAAFYAKLSDSIYLKFLIPLERGKHYYESTTHEVVAHFDSNLVILSSTSIEINIDSLKNTLECKK